MILQIVKIYLDLLFLDLDPDLFLDLDLLRLLDLFLDLDLLRLLDLRDLDLRLDLERLLFFDLDLLLLRRDFDLDRLLSLAEIENMKVNVIILKVLAILQISRKEDQWPLITDILTEVYCTKMHTQCIFLIHLLNITSNGISVVYMTSYRSVGSVDICTFCITYCQAHTTWTVRGLLLPNGMLLTHYPWHVITLHKNLFWGTRPISHPVGFKSQTWASLCKVEQKWSVTSWPSNSLSSTQKALIIDLLTDGWTHWQKDRHSTYLVRLWQL